MVVLLTDFGPGSEYVGVMKGVIYSLFEQARVVDLCHDVTPHAIIEASWVLKNSYRYFPDKAVFCCVVDPGVGTGRKALAVATERYFFVAPDNGLLWETLKEEGTFRARELAIGPDASRTFHGRDVFAKAAAEIDAGRFDRLGTETDKIQRLQFHQKGREGVVVRIDHFGNIVTNLPPLDKQDYQVESSGFKSKMCFCPTYGSAVADELFLIEGSNGTLEISLKNGLASERLGLKVGEWIKMD